MVSVGKESNMERKQGHVCLPPWPPECSWAVCGQFAVGRGNFHFKTLSWQWSSPIRHIHLKAIHWCSMAVGFMYVCRCNGRPYGLSEGRVDIWLRIHD